MRLVRDLRLWLQVAEIRLKDEGFGTRWAAAAELLGSGDVVMGGVEDL